ncbi:MAG: lycopene cyclase domain-containing protein [Flavobacteriales bacterium]|nr:lycopene cyclase domain-containing protein [Flavobacteriales bacterium]MDG1781103.1 lycopene cyclase domain-containing protein [Flavobacteriales bacterium]MDG2246522.1 lycopene cyclase domain-containing protein [Flavobacteriales bacterium]
MTWLYLLVNLGSIAVPFLLSFDKKVAFYTKWKAFWPANLITLLFFVVWDVLFTEAGIWGFNDTYLLGPHLFGLPLEEWLFFICIPYACVFMYETFRSYIKGNPFKRIGRPAFVLLFLLCIALVIAYPERYYTFYTALFTAVGLALLWRKNPDWLGWLVFSYLIILIPFIVANGILTGIEFWNYPFFNENVEGINDMIVWYNNKHNLAYRIFSVPIDDTIYGFLLIGMNISLYELFLKRHHSKTA